MNPLTLPPFRQPVALSALRLTLLSLILGASFATAQDKSRTSQKGITQNPTGLQVGVAPMGAGELPAGTEELSRQGALAAADNDWRRAKLVYEEMILLAPNNPLALSNLGAVEFRLGNMRRAEDLLKRSTEIAPELAQNWMTLGLVYHHQGKNLLAVSALTQALHHDPEDPRIHNFLGVAIRELGWVTGSELELQRALLLDPTYADAHYNLAVMYLDNNLIELARRHYYQALDHGAQPDNRIESILDSKGEQP